MYAAGCRLPVRADVPAATRTQLEGSFTFSSPQRLLPLCLHTMEASLHRLLSEVIVGLAPGASFQAAMALEAPIVALQTTKPDLGALRLEDPAAASR